MGEASAPGMNRLAACALRLARGASAPAEIESLLLVLVYSCSYSNRQLALIATLIANRKSALGKPPD